MDRRNQEKSVDINVCKVRGGSCQVRARFEVVEDALPQNEKLRRPRTWHKPLQTSSLKHGLNRETQ
jgi:hypothetical protein